MKRPHGSIIKTSYQSHKFLSAEEFKELQKYKLIAEKESNIYSKAGILFTVSMSELMQVKKK